MAISGKTMTRTPFRVHVVEDDSSVRRALARYLASLGLQVTTFATAEDLLESTERPADCLILDLNLPGLSGLELHERLVVEGEAVPIVYLSAYGDEQSRSRAMQLGAAAFLAKPFQEQNLLEALHRALKCTLDSSGGAILSLPRWQREGSG